MLHQRKFGQTFETVHSALPDIDISWFQNPNKHKQFQNRHNQNSNQQNQQNQKQNFLSKGFSMRWSPRDLIVHLRCTYYW